MKKLNKNFAIWTKAPIALFSAVISLSGALFLLIKDPAYLFILIGILLTFSSLFVALFSKRSNNSKKEKDINLMAKEVEQKRLENDPDSQPHVFVNGICKNCGNSVSSAQYFRWYSCKGKIG